ncbi:hypothetical protein F7648_06835, partial [Tenacibaculum piscium]|nr:hypothetical protein [Tenacibaculum piscium]
IIKNTAIAQEITKQAVDIYNNLRTHFSLNLRKPAEVHLNPNIDYKSYRRNKKKSGIINLINSKKGQAISV